jgi:hypothetical protein
MRRVGIRKTHHDAQPHFDKQAEDDPGEDRTRDDEDGPCGGHEWLQNRSALIGRPEEGQRVGKTRSDDQAEAELVGVVDAELQPHRARKVLASVPDLLREAHVHGQGLGTGSATATTATTATTAVTVRGA